MFTILLFLTQKFITSSLGSIALLNGFSGILLLTSLVKLEYAQFEGTYRLISSKPSYALQAMIFSVALADDELHEFKRTSYDTNAYPALQRPRLYAASISLRTVPPYPPRTNTNMEENDKFAE